MAGMIKIRHGTLAFSGYTKASQTKMQEDGANGGYVLHEDGYAKLDEDLGYLRGRHPAESSQVFAKVTA
eukprot:5414963-Pyramimonas_sp.AAC.1